MELLGTVTPRQPLLVVAVHLEAEHLHTEHPVLVCGVGKVAASTAVLALLARTPKEQWPTMVINVGTAGALHDDMLGTHVIGEVRQHDLDGIAIERLCGINPSPPIALGAGPSLATGDAFISDPHARRRLGEIAALCDMEGYAVASAATKVGVPVALVKHVSDTADEAAARTWADSVATCSEALGLWLASAPGRALIGG